MTPYNHIIAISSDSDIFDAIVFHTTQRYYISFPGDWNERLNKAFSISILLLLEDGLLLLLIDNSGCKIKIKNIN